MKYIIILGDGMADQPIAGLGGKTPLMAAQKPYIDQLAEMGRSGMLVTVPADMPAGSEIANMGVMGYDVHKVYEGRAYWKQPAWA
jgi:2,3-bisphosphoglycerate-independent phosphoglycerate mutase